MKKLHLSPGTSQANGPHEQSQRGGLSAAGTPSGVHIRDGLRAAVHAPPHPRSGTMCSCLRGEQERGLCEKGFGHDATPCPEHPCQGPWGGHKGHRVVRPSGAMMYFLTFPGTQGELSPPGLMGRSLPSSPSWWGSCHPNMIKEHSL